MPVMTFMFVVNAGSAEPIYKQLIAQVQRAIAAGTLLAGDPMPSVRDVADQLVVNPMTVSKAYSQLEASGVLTRIRGMGMAVAGESRQSTPLSARLALLRPSLETAALESAQLEITASQASKLFAEILKGRDK